MARGCALIDSRPDTAKIGSDGRVEVHRARLRAVFGGRKTFPHSLDPERTLGLTGFVASCVYFSLAVRSWSASLSHCTRHVLAGVKCDDASSSQFSGARPYCRLGAPGEGKRTNILP